MACGSDLIHVSHNLFNSIVVLFMALCLPALVCRMRLGGYQLNQSH